MLYYCFACTFTPVDDMRRRTRLAEGASEFLDLTLKEVEGGYAQGRFTDDEMIVRLGHGGWRALERFFLHQPNGKYARLTAARQPSTTLLPAHKGQFTLPQSMWYLLSLQLLLPWFDKSLACLGELPEVWQGWRL